MPSKLKSKKFVKIRFDDKPTQTFLFNTNEEVSAFLLGCEHGCGREEYVVVGMSKGCVPCEE